MKTDHKTTRNTHFILHEKYISSYSQKIIHHERYFEEAFELSENDGGSPYTA
jgi:hypothetical protein